VLNAKRHQRLGQILATQGARQKAQCSTPKGIKGWDSHKWQGKTGQHVLCSTPYGIKGWDRKAFACYFGAEEGAQRLTASKVGTATYSVTQTPKGLRCSTPKGIKGWDRKIDCP